MIVVFVGPPGAGKGTQSERLVEWLGVPHLSTGDLLRAAACAKTPLGKNVLGFLEGGQLVPDDIVLKIIIERLGQSDCEHGCLLDGFPRTVIQAVALDTLLADSGKGLQIVLELKVDEDVLARRLAGRNRQDDSPEMIPKRLQVYRTETTPLLRYYAKQGRLATIPGMGTPDEVFAAIQTAVRASMPDSDKLP